MFTDFYASLFNLFFNVQYKPFIREHNDLMLPLPFSEHILRSVTTLFCSLKRRKTMSCVAFEDQPVLIEDKCAEKKNKDSTD